MRPVCTRSHSRSHSRSRGRAGPHGIEWHLVTVARTEVVTPHPERDHTNARELASRRSGKEFTRGRSSRGPASRGSCSIRLRMAAQHSLSCRICTKATSSISSRRNNLHQMASTTYRGDLGLNIPITSKTRRQAASFGPPLAKLLGVAHGVPTTRHGYSSAFRCKVVVIDRNRFQIGSADTNHA